MLKVTRRLARHLPQPVRRRITSVLPARFRAAWNLGSRVPVSLKGLATGRQQPLAGVDPGPVVAEVRSALQREAVAVAVAAGEALRRQRATAALGSLVGALVTFDQGHRATAWVHLADVPVKLWSRYAMREYVLSGLAAEPEVVVRSLSDLADAPSRQVDAQGWFDACAAAFGHQETDLARRLFSRLDEAVDHDPGLDTRLVQNRDWLRPWVAATPDSPSAPAAEAGRVVFAVMDYGHPGRSRASANIGDHVQSIASLGHLVRRRGLRFDGQPELVRLLDDLAARVPEDLRVDGPDTVVDVLTVHRDASMYQPLPPRTWALAFGWFMHAIYDVQYGFPFHANLLPVFVSFHCSKRELLTPEAVDYLRRFGPVGCRDWTTVDILLSLGVPAFFSGCLTTTVSTVFPPLADPPGPDAPTACVDLPDQLVPEGAATYRHSSDAVRLRSFERNMRDAVKLLETYRRNHGRLATSRLHAYLPTRSLGMTVDFWPKNRSDPRFEGLMDISDDQFQAMRLGLLAKLDSMLGAILAGGSEEEVYALWRQITADDVAAARERHAAPPAVPPSPLDPGALVARATAASVLVRGPQPGRAGKALELVVPLEGEGPAALRRTVVAVVASAAAGTTRPVNVTVLSRQDVEQVEPQVWAELLPGVGVRVLSTAVLQDALHGPDGRRIPQTDLALALLPELLPELDRVVVLPAAAVVLGDLAELADLDLGGRGLAAPVTRGSRGSSGFGLLDAAAGRLRDHTALAAELRRIAHGRHVFDFDSLTTGVLVLDLAALRRAGFVGEFLPFLPAFGLRWRELLCLYAGPDRAEVPPCWDVVPAHDVVDEPRLLRWPEPPKPWQAMAVPGDQAWRSVRLPPEATTSAATARVRRRRVKRPR